MAITNQAQLGIRTTPMPNGPLAGMVDGMMINDYRDTQQRNFRDSDLENQIRTNEYDNALLDNPVKAMQRENALSEGGLQQELYADGTKRALARSEAETKLSANLVKQSADKLSIMDDRATFMMSAGEFIKGITPADMADPVKWEGWKKEAARLGIDGFPDTPTPENLAKLAHASQVAIQTKPMIQKALQMKQAHANEMEKQRAGDETRIKVAEIGAGAARANKYAGLKVEERIKQEILDAAKAGAEIPQDAVDRLRGVYLRELRMDPPKSILEDAARYYNQLRAFSSPEQVKNEAAKRGLPADSTVEDLVRAYKEKLFKEEIEKRVDADTAGGHVVGGRTGNSVTPTPEAPVTTESSTPTVGKDPNSTYNMLDGITAPDGSSPNTVLDKVLGDPRIAAAIKSGKKTTQDVVNGLIQVGKLKRGANPDVKTPLQALDAQIREASNAGNFPLVQKLLEGRKQLAGTSQ